MYVNNLSATAKNYKYIVANRVYDENTQKYRLWFYGAWNDADKANEVALHLKDDYGYDSIVFDSDDVEG